MRKLFRLTAILCASLSTSVIAAARAQTPVPDWARARWEALAKARSLQLSAHVKVQSLSGDFDGDGKVDIAMLVEHRTTHKTGIVFIHHTAALPRLIGAGTDFGNGGDTFDWMDSWKVQPRTKTRPVDAVVIERESSARALIYYANGKYHWKQLGD